MLTVEIKVNGEPIGYMRIRNLHRVDDDWYEYEYRFGPMDNTAMKSGVVAHRRNDGAFALVRRVLEHNQERSDA